MYIIEDIHRICNPGVLICIGTIIVELSWTIPGHYWITIVNFSKPSRAKDCEIGYTL